MTIERKTSIQPAAVIILDGGPRLADGLPEERCVRTEADRDALPAGTITIGADDCCAVAVGDGTFQDAGLDGAFPAAESVILPAYIVAGPGLPTLVPGGATLTSETEANAVDDEFHAVDAAGTLLAWRESSESRGTYVWESAGRVEPATPVFPVTAWY